MTLFAVMAAFILEVLLVIEMGRSNKRDWEVITAILTHKTLNKKPHEDILKYIHDVHVTPAVMSGQHPHIHSFLSNEFDPDGDGKLNASELNLATRRLKRHCPGPPGAGKRPSHSSQ